MLHFRLVIFILCEVKKENSMKSFMGGRDSVSSGKLLRDVIFKSTIWKALPFAHLVPTGCRGFPKLSQGTFSLLQKAI